ncbi:hypothetical protein ACS0TY_001932 [Phlomoides rotata]
MGCPPVPIVLVCLMMASTHIVHAQTSPQDFVGAHNAGRAADGVQPLVWDDKVAAYAQRYANTRSQDCAMEHSSSPYGENLAAASWEMSAEEAVQMWVDEKKMYDVNSNSCVGGECLHYTQVVWNDTTRVGCATARCLNGWTFVTCNYDPAGNIIGERPF